MLIFPHDIKGSQSRAGLMAFGVILLLLSGRAWAFHPAAWQRVAIFPGSVSDGFARQLVLDDGSVLVLLSFGLYRYNGHSGQTAAILTDQLSGSPPRAILSAAGDPQTIVAVTERQVFLSRDQGHSWQEVFNARQQENVRCLSVATIGEAIYLGTSAGLYGKATETAGWRILADRLSGQPVEHLAVQGDALICAVKKELIRWHPITDQYETIFTLSSFSADSDLQENQDDTISAYVKIAAFADGTVMAASPMGIFLSSATGPGWQRLPDAGLPLSSLKDVWMAEAPETENQQIRGRPSQGSLAAASGKGVYLSGPSAWRPLYQGLETTKIFQIARSPAGRYFALTDRGLYAHGPVSDQNDMDFLSAERAAQVHALFQQEPDIRQVQEWAISYANTHPQRIRAWEKAARRKALVPKLSVSLDGDRNVTTSDSVWGSYSSGGQAYVGPDDKTGYQNFGWSASLSWDLADWIWSTDLTTIDSRNKLNVELREDIVAEVTRLYFERRRMQVQLLKTRGPEGPEDWQQQLRIAELTALIDGLTGGAFRRHVADEN